MDNMNKDKERKKLCLQIKESLGEIRENIKKLSELDSYRDLQNLSDAFRIMSNDAGFEAISIEHSYRDSPRRLEVLSRTSIKDEHSITGNAFLY